MLMLWSTGCAYLEFWSPTSDCTFRAAGKCAAEGFRNVRLTGAPAAQKKFSGLIMLLSTFRKPSETERPCRLSLLGLLFF